MKNFVQVSKERWINLHHVLEFHLTQPHIDEEMENPVQGWHVWMQTTTPMSGDVAGTIKCQCIRLVGDEARQFAMFVLDGDTFDGIEDAHAKDLKEYKRRLTRKGGKGK